jgi:hypothetical protein
VASFLDLGCVPLEEVTIPDRQQIRPDTLLATPSTVRAWSTLPNFEQSE